MKNRLRNFFNTNINFPWGNITVGKIIFFPIFAILGTMIGYAFTLLTICSLIYIAEGIGL